jgi:hypothetical protein
MKSMLETLRIKWVSVLGFATDDGGYCLGCFDIEAIPEDASFITMYDSDYPEGFTCLECCDVVTGEQK